VSVDRDGDVLIVFSNGYRSALNQRYITTKFRYHQLILHAIGDDIKFKTFKRLFADPLSFLGCDWNPLFTQAHPFRFGADWMGFFCELARFNGGK
jgi:hypothetical protein